MSIDGYIEFYTTWLVYSLPLKVGAQIRCREETKGARELKPYKRETWKTEMMRQLEDEKEKPKLEKISYAGLCDTKPLDCSAQKYWTIFQLEYLSYFKQFFNKNINVI